MFTMSQMSGPEQAELVQLVVAHLVSIEQLDRSIFHAGLGSLADYAKSDTAKAMVTDTVRRLSQQYLIVEFVESFLNHPEGLNGHCPPIEAWLTSHRAELLRRKSDRKEGPSETLPPRAVGRLIAAVAGIAALLILGIFLWFQRGPGSTSRGETGAICQIYDSYTRDRILRPFVLHIGSATYRSTDTQAKLPPGTKGEVDKVECKGYFTRAPDHVDDFQESDGVIRRYYLTRDVPAYNDSITVYPTNESQLRLPSYEEIRRLAAEKNHVDPEKVTFLVHNQTDAAVDVQFYYLPPTEQVETGLLLTSNPTFMPPTKPREWSSPFDEFGLEGGYFVFSVSDSGRPAQVVAQDVIYQRPFAILVVTQSGDDPEAYLDFQDTDPRTMP